MQLNKRDIQRTLIVIPCRLYLGERGEFDCLLIGNRIFFKVKGRWRNIKLDKLGFENETFFTKNDLILAK